MTDPEPSATVEGGSVTDALSGPRPSVLAALAGGGAAVSVRVVDPRVLVATLGATGSVVAAAVAAALAVFCGYVALTSYRTTTEVQFYGNGLAVVRSFGPLGRTERAAYDDIDLVVRQDGEPGAYELLRSGKPSVDLRGLRDPERVEKLLVERIPSPAERNEELLEDTEKSLEQRLAERGVVVPGAEDAGRSERPIADQRVFWRGWPRSEPLPESPLIAESGLPGSLGPMNRREPEFDERESSTTTVRSERTTTEELAAGRYVDPSAQELVGGAGFHGRESVRISDGEHKR